MHFIIVHVDVSVQSKNEMVLLLDGLANEDPVAYTLAYGAQSVTGTTPLVLELDSKGTAKIDGTSTKKGNHIDVLTYSVALK